MDGTDLIYILIGLIAILACERFAAWHRWDRYRRLSRRAHVNLNRGIR